VQNLCSTPTTGQFLSPKTPKPFHLHPRPISRRSRAQPRRESRMLRPPLLPVVKAPLSGKD
jgi:hypothetical protein